LEEQENITRSNLECSDINISLRESLQEHQLGELKSKDELKRRISDHDDGISALRTQLKSLVESADIRTLSDQLKDSKFKKLTEDNKRSATTNQVLKQKHELTILSFEASRQENRALQDQLKSTEAELIAFKNHASAKLMRSLNEENVVLKEQGIRMRGEVLSLQSKIEDIESSAFAAVQSIQLLSPEVGGFSPHTPVSGQGETKDNKDRAGDNLSSYSDVGSTRSGLSSSNDNGHRNRNRKDMVGVDDEDDVIVELIMEEDSSVSDYQSDRKQTSLQRVAQQVPINEEFDDDEEEEDTDVEVDFLHVEHSFVRGMKIDEKSAAALSPIVEDRLLRNIFNKYTTETSELLTLTRYVPTI
jgi:hypothetical protein